MKLEQLYYFFSNTYHLFSQYINFFLLMSFTLIIILFIINPSNSLFKNNIDLFYDIIELKNHKIKLFILILLLLLLPIKKILIINLLISIFIFFFVFFEIIIFIMFSFKNEKIINFDFSEYTYNYLPLWKIIYFNIILYTKIKFLLIIYFLFTKNKFRRRDISIVFKTILFNKIFGMPLWLLKKIMQCSEILYITIFDSNLKNKNFLYWLNIFIYDLIKNYKYINILEKKDFIYSLKHFKLKILKGKISTNNILKKICAEYFYTKLITTRLNNTNYIETSDRIPHKFTKLAQEGNNSDRMKMLIGNVWTSHKSAIIAKIVKGQELAIPTNYVYNKQYLLGAGYLKKDIIENQIQKLRIEADLSITQKKILKVFEDHSRLKLAHDIKNNESFLFQKKILKN